MSTNSHNTKKILIKHKGEFIMLNFDKTIEDVIAAQENTTREKAFINLGTKKQIMDSPAFSDAQKDYIFRLKNTYSFELHKSGRYMVITMYYGKTKKYEFIILDMDNFKCAIAESIKTAKLAVLELVNSTDVEDANEVEEEPAATTEEPAEETAADVEEQEGKEETKEPASKKSKK